MSPLPKTPDSPKAPKLPWIRQHSLMIRYRHHPFRLGYTTLTVLTCIAYVRFLIPSALGAGQGLPLITSKISCYSTHASTESTPTALHYATLSALSIATRNLPTLLGPGSLQASTHPGNLTCAFLRNIGQLPRL
ncbi:hypothetical protein E2C01_001853 [Portunus trituberculatus]|uniref:Uncharacterized protein n=1 Tax=Portunus trituberculatus TaxID=210409 RepID=A0A5B7CIN3_PORTR|nr:hypothetical protein [Portunus trituberculatus]